MKRILCALLCLAVLCTSFAFAEEAVITEQLEQSDQPLNQELGEGFLYTMNVYSQPLTPDSEVYIEFPRFYHVGEFDLGIDSRIIRLNEMIEEKLVYMVANLNVRYTVEHPVDINYQCEVTLNSGNAISIVFWGKTVRQGGRDDNCIQTLTVETETMRELRFVDLFQIDDSFAEAFYTEAYHPMNPETSPWGVVKHGVRILEDDYLSHPLNLSVYLKPEGVVIVFYVGGVLGHHFDVQMDYGDLLPYYRLDTEIWKE